MNTKTAPAAIALTALLMAAAACAPPPPEGLPVEPAPTGAGAQPLTCPEDSPGYHIDPETGECWHIDTIPKTTTAAAPVEEEPGPANENTEVEYITMTTGPPVQIQTPPTPEEEPDPTPTTTTEPPPPTTTTTAAPATTEPPPPTTTTTEPPPTTTTTIAPATTLPPATTTTTEAPPPTTTTTEPPPATTTTTEPPPTTTTTSPAGPVVSIPQPGDDVPARNVYYRGEPEVDVTEFPPMANIIPWSDWNRPDREGTPDWGRDYGHWNYELTWWSYPLDIRVGTVLYGVPGGADGLGPDESYVVSRIRKASDCSGGQYCYPHQGWHYRLEPGEDSEIMFEDNDVEQWLIRVCGIIPENREWGASWTAVGVREDDGRFRIIIGWWKNPSVGCYGKYA